MTFIFPDSKIAAKLIMLSDSLEMSKFRNLGIHGASQSSQTVMSINKLLG